jgi:CheY-like chemotaxis protein/signal transduction histidine kinase
MLSFWLTEEGFEVVPAADGRSAVGMLESRKFDLAVTDLKMPGMGGVETVLSLKAVDPEIEVIVTTGYATIETAVQCMKNGAFDYLQKPYDLADLKVVLERALERSHLNGVVAFYEASRALLSTLDARDLVANVLSVGPSLLDADAVAVASRRAAVERADDDPDALAVDVGGACAGDAAPLVRELTARAFATRTALFLSPSEAAAMSSALSPLDTAFASGIVFPLVVRESELGAVVFARRAGRPPFTSLDLRRGGVFASQVAMAFENARLYGELGARLHDLTVARDQLMRAEKLAVVAKLAGDVAHEINNPLAYVRANLESLIGYHTTVCGIWKGARGVARELRGAGGPGASVMAEELVGSVGDEARTDAVIRDLEPMVRETLEGVRRIGDLVGGFRSLAAPPALETPEVIDLGELVEACLPWLSTGESDLSSRRGEVTARVARETRVRVGQGDVRTAIENVFSFFRRRVVEALGGRGEVTVVLEASSGVAFLRISSSSFLLSDDERLRIFDPRLDVDTAHGRRLKLDVELAMASQLIRRNGGDLTALGGRAGGTAFEMTFPLVSVD